jgi:hypothetical protein
MARMAKVLVKVLMAHLRCIRYRSGVVGCLIEFFFGTPRRGVIRAGSGLPGDDLYPVEAGMDEQAWFSQRKKSKVLP